MRNFIELGHRLIIKFSINKYLIKFYKILLLYELKYQSSVKINILMRILVVFNE